jgi:hypothetical protein
LDSVVAGLEKGAGRKSSQPWKRAEKEAVFAEKNMTDIQSDVPQQSQDSFLDQEAKSGDDHDNQ